MTPEVQQDRALSVDPLEWVIRRAEAQTYLQGVADQLQSHGVTVDTLIEEGDAAEQIIKFAHERSAGLIIMSSHGQSGLTGWNVSSVVQKVILRAYTSVMIVRAYQPPTAELDNLRYRRLLVALDGSPRAEAVLPVAANLARAHEAQVLLVHVVRRPEMPRRTPASQEDVQLAEQLVERNRIEAVQYLDEVRARLQVPDVETRLLVSERVTGTLHELAAQEEIDLVLLSAHGYAGETRWPYGTVVTSFVAYGEAPLLILQDVGRDQVVPTRAELAALDYGRR
jgi:nucleotide-binding universal stress UspA family protein